MIKNCCPKCFGDKHLRYLIEHSSSKENMKKGTCPVCDATSVELISEKCNAYQVLYDKLNEVVNCYRLRRKDEYGGPNLREEMEGVWGVFSERLLGERIKQDKLLEFILQKRFEKDPKLFQQNVELKNQPKEENSIFKLRSFEEFSNEIRNEQRFHIKNFNPQLFQRLLSYAVTKINKGEIYYRARLKPSNKDFNPKDLDAPPRHKASSGRANTKGISHLYLADQEITAFKEIRVGLHNEVVIAKYRIKEELNVVHLSELNKISPFEMSEGEVQLEVFAFNIKHLDALKKAVVEPARSEDRYIEYLPIQYIVDFIKSEEYDGVTYASTMHKDGYNLVLFNPERAERLDDLVNYEITDIHYTHSQKIRKH